MLFTRMRSLRPGTPGRRPQNAADHAHHGHPGGRGVIQRVDQLVVDQAIIFSQMPLGRPALALSASWAISSISVLRMVTG